MVLPSVFCICLFKTHMLIRFSYTFNKMNIHSQNAYVSIGINEEMPFLKCINFLLKVFFCVRVHIFSLKLYLKRFYLKCTFFACMTFPNMNIFFFTTCLLFFSSAILFLKWIFFLWNEYSFFKSRIIAAYVVNFAVLCRKRMISQASS